MQSGCPSHGVEIVPARVDVSAHLKYQFEDEYEQAKKKMTKKGAKSMASGMDQN